MQAIYSKAPSFSFGSRHRDLRTASIRANPAPNSYNVPSTIKTTTAGPKIGIKINALKRAKTPGPGNYNISSSHQSISSSRPAFSMGRRLPRLARKQFVPGPGSYNLHKSTSVYTSQPEFTMRPRTGLRQRGGMHDTPGAKYDIPATIGRGQKKTMFGRTFPPMKKSASTPAPNAYSPNKLVTQKTRPQFTMRARTAVPKSSRRANPGPKYMIRSQFGN